MGRVRLQIKKIENKTYRHITFAKRKSGLVKKAYELSTLCDVEVALIIFSPAGKLILFEGKKRLEEIFMHYIDLPQHQRGRLRDQESIHRIIAQLNLETELRRQLMAATYGESNMRIDSQLEKIQNEISLRSAELEDVEKQLQGFLKSPSSIKSISEAELLESTLEETLKTVRVHKKKLEAENSIRPNSEPVHVHPQTAGGSSFIIGNSDYNLNWSQQYDNGILTTSNFSTSIGFQPLRKYSQPLAHEVFPSSLPNAFGFGHSSLCSTSASQFDGHVCHQLPENHRVFNALFPPGLNDDQQLQGRTSAPTEQNNVVGDCSLPWQ